MEQLERYYYSACQILKSDITSFKSFVFGMLDNEEEKVLPYIKALYVCLYYLPQFSRHKKFMESPQIVDSYDLDVILYEWKNYFRFLEEDYHAIEIARSVMHNLLPYKSISPKVIVGIGHYLYALNRLPLKTDGIDVSIEICHSFGDERFGEDKIYVFRINEEYFHIDICGNLHLPMRGGDSFSHPSWYVAQAGGRNCECELAYLEDEINEAMNLGVSVTIEDYSTIDHMD